MRGPYQVALARRIGDFRVEPQISTDRQYQRPASRRGSPQNVDLLPPMLLALASGRLASIISLQRSIITQQRQPIHRSARQLH
jgi:hypothetical protein